MHLLTIPGIVKFDLLKQTNKFKISATDLKTGKSVYSGNLKVDTTKPFSPDKKLILGKWNHVGVRYVPVENTNDMLMELIVAGRRQGGIKIPKTNLKGSNVAVELTGKCNSCKSNDLLIIDEIQFSSVSRGLDYFASGAYETNASTKKKFLSDGQSSGLLKNIGLKKITHNGKSLLDEFFLPSELKDFSLAKNRNKAKAAVSLGKKLFESPLLSVDKNLSPQKMSSDVSLFLVLLVTYHQEHSLMVLG